MEVINDIFFSVKFDYFGLYILLLFAEEIIFCILSNRFMFGKGKKQISSVILLFFVLGSILFNYFMWIMFSSLYKENSEYFNQSRLISLYITIICFAYVILRKAFMTIRKDIVSNKRRYKED